MIGLDRITREVAGLMEAITRRAGMLENRRAGQRTTLGATDREEKAKLLISGRPIARHGATRPVCRSHEKSVPGHGLLGPAGVGS